MFNYVVAPKYSVQRDVRVEGHATPPGLPVVPADLNFNDLTAVRGMHQRLTEALPLQPWWNQTFDSVDTAAVHSAVASLILHKHAAAQQASPHAILDPHQAALAVIARHLSGTGNAELRQTLDTNAARQGISACLADPDRLCLVGRACHRDADAQVSQGRWASAVRDYATAVRAYAQVAGQEKMVAELERQGAYAQMQAQAQANQQNQRLETEISQLVEHAHTLAGQPAAAAPVYLKIATLAFEQWQILDDDEARENALKAIADAGVKAADAYTTLKQPLKAIDANLKAAQALSFGLQYEAAVALYTKVAEDWRTQADALTKKHETRLASVASQNAENAAKQASTTQLQWLLHRSGRICEEKGQYGQAAECYRSAARSHREHGQPVQNRANLQKAEACHGIAAQQQMTAAQDFAAQGNYLMAGHSYARAVLEFQRADQPQKAEQAEQAKQLANARAVAQTRLFEQLAKTMGAYTARVDQNARASGTPTTQAEPIQQAVKKNATLVNQIEYVLRTFPATLFQGAEQVATHQPNGTGGT